MRYIPVFIIYFGISLINTAYAAYLDPHAGNLYYAQIYNTYSASQKLEIAKHICKSNFPDLRTFVTSSNCKEANVTLKSPIKDPGSTDGQKKPIEREHLTQEKLQSLFGFLAHLHCYGRDAASRSIDAYCKHIPVTLDQSVNIGSSLSSQANNELSEAYKDQFAHSAQNIISGNISSADRPDKEVRRLAKQFQTFRECQTVSPFLDRQTLRLERDLAMVLVQLPDDLLKKNNKLRSVTYFLDSIHSDPDLVDADLKATITSKLRLIQPTSPLITPSEEGLSPVPSAPKVSAVSVARVPAASVVTAPVTSVVKPPEVSASQKQIDSRLAELKASDKQPQEIVQAAVEKGYLDVLKHYLDRDPSLLSQTNSQNKNLMHQACDLSASSWNLEVFTYLLEKMKTVKPELLYSAWGEYQLTPLHMAIVKENTRAVEALLSSLSHEQSMTRDGSGQTPIQFAAQLPNNKEVLRSVLKHVRNEDLKDKKRNIDQNAIAMAVDFGNLEFFNSIPSHLNLRNDVVQEDEYVNNLLHLAANTRFIDRQSNYNGIISFLFENGLPDRFIISDNSYGESPLFKAVLANNLGALEIMKSRLEKSPHMSEARRPLFRATEEAKRMKADLIMRNSANPSEETHKLISNLDKMIEILQRVPISAPPPPPSA